MKKYVANREFNMKKFISRAFSLVELMVTLIVVSCLIAAMAPVITKKLKNNSITVSNGSSSGGSGIISCDISCASNQARDSANCECKDCATLFGDACLKCDTNKCSECIDANYLNSGSCDVCPSGYYCDGTNKLICPKGFYCANGEKISCPSGKYNDETGKENEGDCISCSSKTSNCTNCDKVSGICSICESGFDLINEQCEALTFTFTYSGSYEETTSIEGKQKIILKTSGIFKSNTAQQVSLFLVGGGGGGSSSNGCGGAGGYYTQTLAKLENGVQYDTTIGSGGSRGGNGADTTFGTFIAKGATAGTNGYGCTGGQGTSVGGIYHYNNCTNGGDGIEFDGIWYAGAGGGGAANRVCSGGKGGASASSTGSGLSAAENTGGGGGGGGLIDGYSSSGGNGGSGVVIIIVE